MSLLVDGKLQTDWLDAVQKDGEYVRRDSQFRHWVTSDGRAGPSGEGGFQAEPGRYHLYVSLACPWANRTLIFRRLKGLADHISVDVVDPLMPDSGWFFADRADGATDDSLYGYKHVHQLYTLAEPRYTGIVTVPILWDKQRRTIVNNESAEIIRMLNSAFDGCGANSLDFYPAELRPEIDRINDYVYHHINNGVYRCGFATDQAVYDRTFDALFEALDVVEARLSKQRYLVGSRLTEADWRLFTTLVRFDAVYYVHFKCNRRRIAEYPNLSAYVRELYQVPGVAETIDMDQIKQHYYRSHTNLNPTGLVARGPLLDFDSPHDRDRFEGDGRF